MIYPQSCKLALLLTSTVAFFTDVQVIASPLSAENGIGIPTAPASQIHTLGRNPNPNVLTSPVRQRHHAHKNRHSRNQKASSASAAGQGQQTINTIYSGVYPVLNVTWIGDTRNQSFVSFIDTGSADTFSVSNSFQCVGIEDKKSRPQSACGFGPLFNSAQGKFSKISNQKFSISYFPEMEQLKGDMGYSPIQVGGITVPKQEVALVNYAAWEGDDVTSGLIGLAYPPVTSAEYTSGASAQYDPIFTTMSKQKLIDHAVFTLAVNRVPRNTPTNAPAGVIAFGGLVPDSYIGGPFTTVPIEVTKSSGSSSLTWYTTTHQLVYGKTAASAKPFRSSSSSPTSGTSYQSIVDSGTAPNFVPTAAAKAINALFEPAATYNSTLGYWTVDCNAKAPYVAFKIGGKDLPMDSRDLIVRSLNGRQGYENVCFSSFADGGNLGSDVFIIGEVWQRSYVIAYDVEKTQLHFAPRAAY